MAPHGVSIQLFCFRATRAAFRFCLCPRSGRQGNKELAEKAGVCHTGGLYATAGQWSGIGGRNLRTAQNEWVADLVIRLHPLRPMNCCTVDGSANWGMNKFVQKAASIRKAHTAGSQRDTSAPSTKQKKTRAG